MNVRSLARLPLWAGPIAWLSLGLAGCNYSDPGEGTETLEVIARATYRTVTDETRITVEVRNADRALVADASVTMVNDDTHQSVLLPSPTAGVYAGTLPGYVRHLALEVTTPAGDELATRLEAPGPHTIVQPHDDRHALSDNLSVSWAAADGLRADYVVVELNPGGFTSVLVSDTGSYVIPQTFLRVGLGALRLQRANALQLTGGIGASTFTVAYEVEQPITVE